MMFPIIDVYEHPRHGDSVRYENYVELQEMVDELEARHAALREAVANLRKVENDEHVFSPGHYIEQRLAWQEKRDAARAEVDRLIGGAE